MIVAEKEMDNVGSGSNSRKPNLDPNHASASRYMLRRAHVSSKGLGVNLVKEGWRGLKGGMGTMQFCF